MTGSATRTVFFLCLSLHSARSWADVPSSVRPADASAVEERTQRSNAEAVRPTSPVSREAPSPSGASPEIEAQATKLWDEASRLYSAGEYAAAYERMASLYQLTRDPHMLYNLADLSRELGQCRRALAQYEEYLARAAEAEYRVPAQSAVVELRQQCPDPPVVAGLPPPKVAAQPSRGGSPVPDAQGPARGGSASVEPTRDARVREVLGYSLLTAGAAAGVGAAIFLGSAVHKNNRLQDANREAAERPVEERPLWSHSEEELEHARDRHRNWSIALGISSAALLGSGLAVLLWPRQEASSSRAHPYPSLSFRASAHGLGLSLRLDTM